MASERVGGLIEILFDGKRIPAKGNFTYNIGQPLNTAIVGSDGTHGYMSKPQVPYLEGATTHDSSLDLTALLKVSDATITLTLPNKKIFILRNAWFAKEGEASTEEGEVSIRFEGLSAEIIA